MASRVNGSVCGKIRGTLLAWGLGLALLIGAGAARAELPPMEETTMSLDDVLRIALENNLDLVAARLNPEISNQSVQSEMGAFDPTLTASSSHTDTTREAQTSLLAANDSVRTDLSTDFTESLAWGGNYSAAFSITRQDAPGFGFQAVNPTYDADITLSYAQELLAGFGREATQTQLLTARTNLEISYETLKQTTQTTLQQVETAYWALAAAIQALDVEYEGLERANRFLELNRKQVEVGTLAPIEVVTAEAQVASQEEQVIIAETALENAEDDLRRLMGIAMNDEMWTKRLKPSSQLSFSRVTIDLEQAIETALDRRPELVSARKTLKNNDLAVRAARNRLRPGLRGTASLISLGDNAEFEEFDDGMGGTVAVPIQGLGGTDATEEIFDVTNYTWQARLDLTLPIGNRANRASYRTAQLNKEQAQVDITNQERGVEVEVRRAAREVTNGIKRVEAARANVRLQEKNLEAEQKKFENGMSTSFRVLEFQDDLSNAQLAEIRALVDYTNALTELARVQGTLLEYRGLELQP